MRREVMGTEVRFDLDDAPDARYALGAPDEELAEEVAGDRDGVAIVEIAWQPAQHGSARSNRPSTPAGAGTNRQDAENAKKEQTKIMKTATDAYAD